MFGDVEDSFKVGVEHPKCIQDVSSAARSGRGNWCYKAHRAFAGSSSPDACLFVGLEEFVLGDTCLDADGAKRRASDVGVIRHGEGRLRPIRILADHCQMRSLSDQPEAQPLQWLNGPCFRDIHRKRRHQTVTVASAMKASRTGDSASSASDPKVWMWKRMADRTSSKASS